MIDVGGRTFLYEEDVIGIFDADTATVEKATKELIARHQKEGRLIFAKEDLPKSFILTGEKLIFSPWNPKTILDRKDR